LSASEQEDWTLILDTFLTGYVIFLTPL
jgi:hypothetical protein